MRLLPVIGCLLALSVALAGAASSAPKAGSTAPVASNPNPCSPASPSAAMACELLKWGEVRFAWIHELYFELNGAFGSPRTQFRLSSTQRCSASSAS